MQPVSSQRQCVKPSPPSAGVQPLLFHLGSKKHEQARCCLSLRNIFTNKMKCMLFQRLSPNKASSVKYLPSSSSLRHRAQVSWCGTPSSLRSDPKAPSYTLSPITRHYQFSVSAKLVLLKSDEQTCTVLNCSDSSGP